MGLNLKAYVMDTIEYSEHVMRIGKNIRRIAENVESAADNELEGEEQQTAIEQARARLADYTGVAARLAVDSKTLEVQFTKRFADDIELIRDSLDRIDAESDAANDQ